MSADFTTYVELKGQKKEILRFVYVLNKYSFDTKEFYLETYQEREFYEKLARESNGNLSLNFGGPYGKFDCLGSAIEEIAKDLASCVPNGSFVIESDGFSYGREMAKAELKDGQLFLYFKYPPDELDEEFEEDDDGTFVWDRTDTIDVSKL